MTDTPPLVVIGASLGALAALRTLVAGLPSDLPASVLIVTHTGAYPSLMPELLQARSALPVNHPTHEEILAPARIYVAPADHHMVVDGHRIGLNRDPKEHHTRPAVDPLFRTAALWHGQRVIGVVLTGNLDDGTAGLQAIKALGGTAIVQDPREAEAPSMPRSALRHVEVDHCVCLDEMSALIASLAQSKASHIGSGEVAETVLQMQEVTRRQIDDEVLASKGNAMERLRTLAKPSSFTCPDCGGGLWEINASQPPRYRCHTGHAFSLRSLNAAQHMAVEEALWSAIRALQEKAALLARLAESDPQGDAATRTLQDAAVHARQQADALRQLVHEEDPECLPTGDGI